MLIRSMMLRGAAAVGSALKFTQAGTGWTLSSDGLTATRDATNVLSLTSANIARSTGPAGVLYKPQSGTPSGSISTGVSLYPAGVATDSPPTTNRVNWRGDGSININGTDVLAADASRSWGAGDLLLLRESADGGTITFLRNGTQVASQAVTVTSRVPAVVSANGTAWSCIIDGAPAGETAWG